MQESKELTKWFVGKRIERTIAALEKNGFGAKYFATANDACEEIIRLIPAGSKVGVGGSLTLKEMGLIERLERREDVTLLNPEKILQEEKNLAGAMAKILPMIREIYTADLFFSSTNALTEKGQLFNIDGVGNRTGAMFFGPKQVIVVAGQNKIVKNLDEAVWRVRHYVAPRVNKRHPDLRTPCVKDGVCHDCDSPARTCNIFVTLHRRPMNTPITVFLIGEDLGI